MKFAVSMPNFGAFADVRRLAELAKEAEDNGWDGFFLWDHIHWMGAPMIDPWVALAAMALATERIRIGTMVTPVARRRPWKLARETVTLDRLSGGRFTLGVGLGFPPDEEFARLGEDPDDRTRARKLDEGLDVLLGLWSGEPFSYKGEHYQLNDVRFLPRPVQQPRIPIWAAGFWPHTAPFRRAARFNGAFPIGSGTSGEEISMLTPSDIHAIRAYIDSQRPDPSAPYDIVTGAFLPEDPSEAKDAVAAFEAAGLTWLVLGGQSPDELSALLRGRQA